MRYALYISILFLLISCDPSKRILKNKEQFEKVGSEWATKNPCVNDTFTVTKTDTLTKIDTVETVRYETLGEEYIITDAPVKVITRTITKNVYIHDTVTNNIEDSRTLKAVTKQLNDCKTDKAQFVAKVQLLSKQLMTALSISGVLLTFLVIAFILLFKR